MGPNPASYAVRFTGDGVAMSLCWCSNTDESKASLNVRLLLALDEFLFEDIPRYGLSLPKTASGSYSDFQIIVVVLKWRRVNNDSGLARVEVSNPPNR